MEVPRLGVQAELRLLAHAIATATRDQSHICDLYHSSQKHWVLNPLIGAREQTHILIDTSWVRYCEATTGTPLLEFLSSQISPKTALYFQLVLELPTNGYPLGTTQTHPKGVLFHLP